MRQITTSRIFITDLTSMKLWIEEVHSFLLAGGLVRTDDTGQIDLDTITYPNAAATLGYSVWRFNDELQSSAPIFIRVNFTRAAGGAPANLWTVGATVGVSTNGAGVILAADNTIITFNDNFLPVGGVQDTGFPSYVSAGAGYFMLLYKVGTANIAGSNGFLFIMRTQDSDGTPNNYGFIVHQSATTANSSSGQLHIYRNPSYLPFYRRVTGLGNYNMIANPFELGTIYNDAGMPRVIKFFTPNKGGTTTASDMLCGSPNVEIPHFTIFTADILGNERTFLKTSTLLPPLSSQATNTNAGFIVQCIRWED